MISGLFEAVNGSLNEELRLSIITNNLANVNVAGYKKDRLSFEATLRTQLNHANRASSIGEAFQDQELYRRIVKVNPDMTQGRLRHTGNPLDLAISGPGFFKVSTPEGIRYTRNGSFSLNDQGMIVTSIGHLVLGKGGPIRVPPGELQVDSQGEISVDGESVGSLDVGAFERPEDLERDGQGLFRPGDLSEVGSSAGDEATVQQGHLEEANVNAAEEMIKMMTTVRSYESYQKIIHALHEINIKAIEGLGRVK